MLISLQNEALSVDIETLGGELRSIRGGGTEYLWQGDPAYWSGCAINLFPFIARLTQNKYLYNGREYGMGIHGFWRNREMAVEDRTASACTLLLRDDEETRAAYPFPFELRVQYRLEENRLSVIFLVKNTGAHTMYFGIGGHPGFNVPLEEGLSFEEYCLVFDAPPAPRRVGFTPACYLTGESAPFPLELGHTLPLRHSLFDDDAIVLQDAGGAVVLKSEKGARYVRVECPQMPYLGFWHTPNSDAPFVCVEPWSSLPSRQDVIEELTQKEDLVSLAPGGLYENRWVVECG